MEKHFREEVIENGSTKTPQSNKEKNNTKESDTPQSTEVNTTKEALMMSFH